MLEESDMAGEKDMRIPIMMTGIDILNGLNAETESHHVGETITTGLMYGREGDHHLQKYTEEKGTVSLQIQDTLITLIIRI